MRTFVSAVVFVTATGIALYSIWVYALPYDPAVEAMLSSICLFVLSLLIFIFGLCIAANKEFAPSMRRAWIWIALSGLTNAIAEMLWFYYQSIVHTSPFPSLADAFYLLFYPFMLAGILSLPSSQLKRRQGFIQSLDIGIVVTVGGLFLWYFVLAPMRLGAEGGSAEWIAWAYPIADLFILAGIVSLIQRDLEGVGGAVLSLLGVSMFFTLLADILFTGLDTYTISYTMAPLNIFYLVSYWSCMTAAVWQLTRIAPRAPRSSFFYTMLRTILIYIPPAAGMGLVLLTTIRRFESDIRLYGTLLGSFGLVALVLWRQYITLQDNRRLYKEMEHLAETDTLTSLYNRHFFDESIVREVNRARRFKRALSLLLMDLDNFKAYNDKYGHLQGDVILQEVGKLLKVQFRSSDVVARFGGDEFVAILPETNIKQAQVVAGKVQQMILSAFLDKKIGMSIGAAALQPGMSVADLLGRADEELYRVKPH